MNKNERNISVSIVLGMVFLLLLSVNSLFSDNNIVHTNLDTDGSSRGLAVQGNYAYVADGLNGLIIVNISNPRGFMRYGSLYIPDGYIEQVAVSGDLVVLTDSASTAGADLGKVHFVDAHDKMRPRLTGSLAVRGNRPHTLINSGRLAYVVEYGADPTGFAGIEVFSCGGAAPRSTQLTAIPGIRDIAACSKYVLAATTDSIIGYRRSTTGFSTTEADRLTLPAEAKINSLALYAGYLFAFGSNIHVVGHILPDFAIVFRWVPFPFPGHMVSEIIVEIPLRLTHIARVVIPGDGENRRVDAAIPTLRGGGSTTPLIALLLTTSRCYGLYTFNYRSRGLLPFPIEYRSAADSDVLHDVHESSDGKITIYDAAFPHNFQPGYFNGGLMALGAVGSYGLAYVYVE